MIPFIKMHGLGNDCVIIDARDAPVVLSADRIRRIADRRRGVGCNQLALLQPPRDGKADVFVRFFNADGSESAACGNGIRCIAAHLMQASGSRRIILETQAGLLPAHIGAQGLVTVDMGPPGLGWRDVPLARNMDTAMLDFSAGRYEAPGAVSMGNPHCVFFVEDADAVDLAELGPAVENNPLFPERTNVEFIEVLAENRLRMRVWERGAGITQACGSGACAAVVAAARRAKCGRNAEVMLDGGSLFIEWQANDHVLMSGPVAVAFNGAIDDAADLA
jgi:diaminopimelate epimerase